MKLILVTLVLTCALCVSAFAGEIPTCSPSPAAVTSEVHTVGSEPVAGNMPTAVATVSSEGEANALTALLTLITLIVS
jgi:hypothetical protein